MNEETSQKLFNLSKIIGRESKNLKMSEIEVAITLISILKGIEFQIKNNLSDKEMLDKLKKECGLEDD